MVTTSNPASAVNTFAFLDNDVSVPRSALLEQEASSTSVASSTTIGNTLNSLATRSYISVNSLISGSSITSATMSSGMYLVFEDGFDPGTFPTTNAHEKVQGTSRADTIYGKGGHDVIFGGYGNDLLDGGEGDDFLEGNGGNDTLTGGAGSDRYIFTEHDNVSGSSGYDRITGFSHSLGEKLIFSEIDAKTTVSGNQAFTFIGSSAFDGIAGQIRYYHSGENTYIAADVNGDAQTDYRVRIDGVRTMYVDDFIL